MLTHNPQNNMSMLYLRLHPHGTATTSTTPFLSFPFMKNAYQRTYFYHKTVKQHPRSSPIDFPGLFSLRETRD